MESREARSSQRIIKALKHKGVFAFKLSDRFQIGVPDIYVAGGVWVENKWTDRASVNMDKMLRPEQFNWANKLTYYGDVVYMVISGPKGYGISVAARGISICPVYDISTVVNIIANTSIKRILREYNPHL